jgi:hypothetical protein
MLNTYIRLVCKTYPWSDASTIRQKLYLLFIHSWLKENHEFCLYRLPTCMGHSRKCQMWLNRDNRRWGKSKLGNVCTEWRLWHIWYAAVLYTSVLNPLNAELNPICHLLALLGAHHIFYISGLRVKCQILMISHRTLINKGTLHASVHISHCSHCKVPPCFTKKYIWSDLIVVMLLGYGENLLWNSEEWNFSHSFRHLSGNMRKQGPHFTAVNVYSRLPFACCIGWYIGICKVFLFSKGNIWIRLI